MPIIALTVSVWFFAPTPVNADQPECEVLAQPLRFGSYDPSAPYDTTASSTIDVQCTKARKLEVGLITNDPCTRRYMRSGLQTLAYNMYLDSGLQIVWGSKNPRCGETAQTDSGFTFNFTVYASIPRLQTVEAGTYVDTVTVNVDF